VLSKWCPVAAFVRQRRSNYGVRFRFCEIDFLERMYQHNESYDVFYVGGSNDSFYDEYRIKAFLLRFLDYQKIYAKTC